MDYQVFLSGIRDQEKIVAVIGASQNEKKYGFKVTKKLVDNHFSVVPVNPKAEVIYNLQAVQSIEDLEQSIALASIVTPPAVSREVCKQLISHHIPYVWFQPGSYDESVLALFDASEVKPIYGPCILIEIDKLLSNQK